MHGGNNDVFRNLRVFYFRLKFSFRKFFIVIFDVIIVTIIEKMKKDNSTKITKFQKNVHDILLRDSYALTHHQLINSIIYC